jgi:osmotically-inducible protein OsmY
MRHAGLLPSLVPAIAALALAGCIETAVIGGRSEINDLWFKDEHGQVLMRDLNLQVQEGRVLVSGEVANADIRARAVQLAWKASGVREVLNEVEVGNSGGLRTYWTDSKIVRELEARMLLEKGITSPNYSVESYNGTVFLIGVAQDQTELNRVLQLARNISSVKKVVNHVLLKDDPRRFRAPAS